MKKERNFIDKSIIWLLSKLNQYNLYRINKYGTSIIDNSNKYEVLLPDDNSDEKGYYSEALKVALNTPKVNNIAITGPYGSGKSSFIESFKERNAEWNYLPISLATFKNQKEEVSEIIEEKKSITPDNPRENKDEEKSENKSKFELHQDVERSILQQFFYREKDDDVPYSRFKKIHNIKKKWILVHSFFVTFIVSYSFLMYSPEKFKKLFLVNPLEVLDISYHKYLTIVFVGVVIFYLYTLFHYLQNIQISKFNFKKGEISLAKQDKASILNEHLDELLYFFEVTSYNVVFFEDIDRFDDTEIFIKLRELNNLINNSKQINRRIIFIYAIRDDMFTDKERTKFFDFIVPIIPYINPSNSERKLVDKFKKDIEDKKIDENFISQVSLYIDDMRLLLNIYNEYMVYKKNLESDKLNHTQLLALIICKNFYPLEFAKLHTREGIIYDLFANKHKYIENRIKEYKAEKQELENQINNIEKENIESLEELRMIYLAYLLDKTNSIYFKINNAGSEYSIVELKKDDIFGNFIQEERVYAYIKDQYERPILPKWINLKEITEELEKEYPFNSKQELINEKNNNKVNELKKDIEDINKKINQLRKITLKHLFETSSHFTIEGYEDKGLLIFLVRNGYIDEYYEDYISYFHKGGITQNDREFLLSLQNYSALDFTFRLDNIKKLLEKLQNKNFEQKEILNFNLINFLLHTSYSYEDKLDMYFKKISDCKPESVDFIFAFLDDESNITIPLFLKRLEWGILWSHIYDEFSSEKQDKYFDMIFKYLTVEKIIKLNWDGKLKKYIEDQTILPIFVEEEYHKFNELLGELNIKFKKIDNPENIRALLGHIYANKHYVITKEMIETIISNRAINIQKTELYKAHLTTIYQSDGEKLIEYIDENINEYIENVFLTIETNTKESEKMVISLLNNENISFENKVKVLQQEEVKISNINELEDKELWAELFKNNKIEATWDNVMSYYLNNDMLDDVLTYYLNIEENSLELSKIRIDKSYCEQNDDFNTQILRDIIESSKFDLTSYELLIKNLGYWYKDLDISNLDEEKISLLIKHNIFQFEKICFDILKEHTKDQHIALIEKNKHNVLEKFNEFAIDEDDLVLLLQSDKFETEEKFSFIEQSDLSNIKDKVPLKEIISKFYIDNSKDIEDLKFFELLFYGENKYDLELLILHISSFDDCDTISAYLDKFTNKLNELLEISAKPLYIDNNKLNNQLLEGLNKKNCIGKFSEENSFLHKNKLKVYRKRK